MDEITKRAVFVFSILLFLISGSLRFYKLDYEGINPDEDIWHLRVDNFISAVQEGNWFYTQQSLHPGVTFEWLTAGGRVFAGAADRIPENDFWSGFWARHRAMVMPIVLVTSFTVVGVYLLLLQLFDATSAFVCSLLIALDPFFLAHSRVVQMDALLASFMILSVLSLLVYLEKRDEVLPNQAELDSARTVTDCRGIFGGCILYKIGSSALFFCKRRVYLILSAVFGGFAILTKLPAVFLVLYVGLVLFIGAVCAMRYAIRNKNESFLHCSTHNLLRVTMRVLLSVVRFWLVWLIIAGLVFIVLYPAVWVEPILTVKNLIYGLVSRGLTADSEAVNRTFYLGQVLPAPGLLFYPLVLALRSTPLSFLFGLLGLGLSIVAFGKNSRFSNPVPFYLLLYCLFFTLQMTLLAKSGDRYLLPVFLAFDILAGYCLVIIIRFVADFFNLQVFPVEQNQGGGSILVLGLLLLVHFGLLVKPLNFSYLSYYNSLFGGGRTASRTMVVGWGEGLRQAAEYLNQKENSDDLKVASVYADALQPYLNGQAWELGQVGDSGADYVVLYINMIQRKNHPEYIEKYYQQEQAEKVVSWHGINYAYIYKVR